MDADTYESLLALDENNVSKGICRRVQERVIRKTRFKTVPARGGGSGRPTQQHTCCAVCQDDFKENEEVAELPCGHPFHFDCVSPWLERDRTCPTCRKEVYHAAVPN